MSWLDDLRKPQPEETGTRIRLRHTSDPHTHLQPGAEGTVRGGNGAQLWVAWDDGSSLSLIPGEDSWEVVSMP